MIEYTESQKRVIATLKRAINSCRKQGLVLFTNIESGEIGIITLSEYTISSDLREMECESISLQESCGSPVSHQTANGYD
jgi:hypothetical protein